MKLHLPTMLRRAVMACMTAVVGISTTVATGAVFGGAAFFALASQQAVAEDITITTSGDKKLIEATAEDKIILNLNSDNRYLYADSANATYTINADVEIQSADMNNGSSNKTYIFKGTITGSGVFDYNASRGSNTQTFLFDGDMTGYSGNMSIAANKTGTFTFKNSTGTGSITALNAASEVNFINAAVNSSSVNVAKIYISGNTTFKSGCSITAGSLLQNKSTLTLDGIKLGSTITNVDGGTVTLTGTTTLLDSLMKQEAPTTNGFVTAIYTLVNDASTLTLGAGAKLQKEDGTDVTAQYSDGKVTVADGTIYNIVEAGTTVSSANVTGETGFIISGAGAKLVLNDVIIMDELADGVVVNVGNGNSATVSIGSLLMADATSITRQSGTLNVEVLENGVLVLSQNTGSPRINGDITIQAGGRVNSTTGDTLGYQGGAPTKNIYMQGKADNYAQFDLTNRVTMTTNIILGGYTKINNAGSTAIDTTADPAGFDTFGGSITATGTDNTIGICISERNALTVDVTGAGDTLEISGLVYNSKATDGSRGITKTGDGTLTFSYKGDLYKNTFTGALTVEGGKVVLASDALLTKGAKVANGASLVGAADATYTLGSAIKVAAGGSYDGKGAALNVDSVGSLALLGEVDQYVDVAGAVSENGYRSGLFALIEGEAGAEIKGVGTVTVGGEQKTVTYDTATGSALVADTDYSTYYVNTTVNYDADTMGGINAYSVSSGGTLNTTLADMLGKVTLADDTSKLYLTNADGDAVLQFTGNQGNTGLVLTVAEEKDADGKWVVTSGTPQNSGYAGSIEVLSGTKLVAGTVNDSLGANYLGNTTRTITVQGGAELDIAGKEAYYHVVLEEGAVLSNNGGNVGTNSRKLPIIDLNGSATVVANGEFGMLGSNWGTTDLNLNGNTLTKIGSEIFHLRNTAVDSGVINVQEGRLLWMEGTVLNGTVVQIGNGAQMDYADAGATRTLGTLIIRTTTGENKGGSIDVYGGTGSLTVSGTTTADELFTKMGGGTLKLNGATAFNEGVTVENGTLELNGATTIGGLITVADGFTLKVGGTGSVSISSLDNFTTTPAEIPTTNGLASSTGTYEILKKGATSKIEGFTAVKYLGKDYTLDDTGSVTIGSTIYYAVEKDSIVTVGGTGATDKTDEADGFYVGKGATLNIEGAASDNVSVNQILVSTAGDGTMVLKTNGQISNAVTLFTGKLSIAQGVELNFGYTKGATSSMSSFSAIELDGGKINYNNVGIALNNFTVTTKGGSMYLPDFVNLNENPSPILFAGTMQLDGDFTCQTEYKSLIDIEALSGSGRFVITTETGNNRSDGGCSVDIASISSYTGIIELDPEEDGTNRVNVKVTLGDSETFAATQIQNNDTSKATLTLSGTGTFDNGSSLNVDGIALADTWAGTVKVSGVSVAATDVLAPTGLSNANSTLELAGLTLAKGGQLTLGGNVKLSGAVVLGDAITSSAMAATFGTDLALDLTGLESVVTEDGKHVFTLFKGDAVDLSTLTAANLSVATKGMAAADTDWTFGTDGTVTLANLVQYRNSSGAWADDDWTNKDGSISTELKTASSVVFNATGTDTVTINAGTAEQVKVLDMTVESGKYEFDGIYGASAMLTVAGELSTAAGTESSFQMSVTADSLENAGTIQTTGAFTVTGDANVTDGSISATRFGLSVGGDYTQSGGSVATAGLAVGGDYTQTGGDMRTDSLTVTGDAVISGGSIGAAGSNTVTISGVSIGNAGVDNVNLTDSTITGQLTNNNKLTLSGTITVDDANFTPTEAVSSDNQYFVGGLTTPSTSGFMVGTAVIQLVTGTGSLDVADDLQWKCSSNDDTIITFDKTTGKLTRTDNSVGSVFYVNTGDTVAYDSASASFTNSKGQEATGLVLDGGDLKLNSDLAAGVANGTGIAVRQDAEITVGSGVTLEKGQLQVNDDAAATLAGAGTYYLNDAAPTQLGSGVSLGEDWTGTVQMDDQLLGSGALQIADALFNASAGSTVQAGAITAGALSVGGAEDDTFKATSIKLQGASSIAAGTTQVSEGVELLSGSSLALRGDLSAASLNIASGATLTGADSKVTLGSVKRSGGSASVISGTLAGTGTLANTAGHSMKLDNIAAAAGWNLANSGTLNVDITNSGNLTLGALALESGSATKLTFNSDNSMTGLLTLDGLTLNGGSLTLESTGVGLVEAGEYVLGTVANGADGSGALTTLLSGAAFSRLDAAQSKVHVDASGNIILTAVKSSVNELAKVADSTNAKAGAILLWDAETPAGSLMEDVYNSVTDMIENGNVAGANNAMAAVAGSSTATLGMALASDVDRQLRAIRNRTTTMGVNQTIVNEGLPYVNAWVNAEGNHGELDSDGTAAGYTMDSWGGTIGFDVDVNSHLTVGMALTAMYGDLTADGPDTAEGDMDTLYLSAFARYAVRATTHTFVATIGRMDGSLERTVNYGSGSYKTTGDMDGMALGLMYEYGRVYKLTEDGDACWQPIVNVAWRSTFVSGYNESGSDAALRVDDQTMHTLTIGAGARMQAIVGENLYNRTSILELRALAKVDVGDTKSEVDVALLKGGKCAGIESAELGMFGIELGAGLSVPVGNVDNGTLFFDASAEIRDGYTNFNGTVGYRINF